MMTEDLVAGATDGVTHLRYDTHADAVIELMGADGPRSEATLVMLIHGGFWRTQYDRRGARPLASALAEAGFVVALPEYRRVGEQSAQGGWPVTGLDLVEAMKTTRQHLARMRVQLSRTVVIGHSAGGQLALWLAGNDPGIDVAVGLAAVADLREAARLELGQSAVQEFLGGEPDVLSGVYDDADPVTILAGSRCRADVVLVHGELDEVVPIEISEGLARVRPSVRLVRLSDMEHFGLIDPLGAAWPVVLTAARGPQ